MTLPATLGRDFSTWQRENLESLARDLTRANSELLAENEELKANNKVLLDQWRTSVARGIGYMLKAKAWDNLSAEVATHSPIDSTTMKGLENWMCRTFDEVAL